MSGDGGTTFDHFGSGGALYVYVCVCYVKSV
jgi:hypothetical protein